MEPGAVGISSLGAAGTATLVNKIRSSSKGAGRGSRRTVLLTTLLLLAPAIAALAAINLSPADTRRIGKRVWQNECNGTLAGLTSWNEGENFASLGIGHFIWYPKRRPRPVRREFSEVREFCRRAGREAPGSLARQRRLPVEFARRIQSGEPDRSDERIASIPRATPSISRRSFSSNACSKRFRRCSPKRPRPSERRCSNSSIASPVRRGAVTRWLIT